MAEALTGKRIAFLIVSRGAAQSEALQPWAAVRVEGGRPLLVGAAPGEIELFGAHGGHGSLRIDAVLGDTCADEYDALVLPDGSANADRMRITADAAAFAAGFFAAGKPVAAICCAPSLLAEADLVRDRRLTSWPGLRTRIEAAGGVWADEPVVVCDRGPNALVTGRAPQDLPLFCRTFTSRFAAHADDSPMTANEQAGSRR